MRFTLALGFSQYSNFQRISRAAEEAGWTSACMPDSFFFPKATPEPIVRALNKAAGTMLEMPSVREQWRQLGLEVPAPETRSSDYLARHDTTVD